MDRLAAHASRPEQWKSPVLQAGTTFPAATMDAGERDRYHIEEIRSDNREGAKMTVPKNAVLLRAFIGEDDRYKGSPLYECIVMKARELHVAGATVLRGAMGFGHSSRVHTTKILRLSQDLPLVVEIVDSEDKVNGFLPILDEMMTSGLVTLEKVQVLQYGEGTIREPTRLT
jgi:PII-like signaling protein